MVAASVGAVGLEHEREQAGAEVRAHHALAGRGEQHLLDQVADVIELVRRGAAAAAVEVVGVVERWHRIGSGQVARTRVCADTGTIGLPVGTQVDWPLKIATGKRPAVTFLAPEVHFPVAQGELSGQPAIEY